LAQFRTSPNNLPPPDDKLGAPAALRRFQIAELDAYRNHKAAVAYMLAASEAEASWIRIASQMRHHEDQVKQADRASGELISKKEMQDACVALADWIRLSFKPWISSEAPTLVAINDPAKFDIEANAGFRASLKFWFENSRKSKNAIPAWIPDV
jgi:hypothetical protein